MAHEFPSEQAPLQAGDVFSHLPYRGNPLAVVLEAEGLSDDQLQTIARWTHLSETTFVLPPTDPAADYRVRIFTTDTELPFAGHPTLGTAHALLEAGLQPHSPSMIIQECGVGLVQIERLGAGALAFRAPGAALRPLDSALQQLVDAAIPGAAVPRPPVTGSANACIARVLQASGQVRAGSRYRAHQGTLLHRDGRIEVSYHDGDPWVGGRSITLINGVLSTPESR